MPAADRSVTAVVSGAAGGGGGGVDSSGGGVWDGSGVSDGSGCSVCRGCESPSFPPSASLVSGREAARLSPIRRDKGDPRDARLVRPLERATRNLRVLVRRVTVALEADQALPTALPEILDELAEQLDPSTAADDAAGPLIDLAGRLDPEQLGASSLSGQVVVAQLRVAMVDILEGIGLDHDRAREALPTLRP